MDGETEIAVSPGANETANNPTPDTGTPEPVAGVDAGEQPADGSKPANGYEGPNFVEFTPEQQKRINTLTKKSSLLERSIQERDDVLRQQSELINELRQGQGQIVDHLRQQNYGDAEAQLKSQRKSAWEKGDIDAVDSINDKLAEIKIQRKIQEAQPKQQPVQPKVPTYAADPVDAAVSRGEISRSDAEVFQAWQNETDMNGNLMRPWVNERDPRNMAAAAEGKAVFSNPSYQQKPFSERLKEIDRRMGLQQQQTNQGVLPSGNLTRGGKTSNIKLSSWAEDLAVKTKFAGSGKSRADHIEAYRAQMAEVRGARR